MVAQNGNVPAFTFGAVIAGDDDLSVRRDEHRCASTTLPSCYKRKHSPVVAKTSIEATVSAETRCRTVRSLAKGASGIAGAARRDDPVIALYRNGSRCFAHPHARSQIGQHNAGTKRGIEHAVGQQAREKEMPTGKIRR